MLQIDITSDIDAAMKDVDAFFWREVPFGTAGALNATIFDVRRHIVEVTYPRSFEVRNRAFPRVLFRIMPKATKRKLETMLVQHLDRGYVAMHADGGTKRGRSGGRVAIPDKPEKMRTKNGRIRATNKPRRIVDRKDVFVVEKGSRKFILKRGRKGAKNELLYSIVPEAQIKKSFRFYEDAEKVTLRVFSGHWNTQMDRAIRSSRFYVS